jgi:uncharacterized protein (DUF1330 family)
MEPVYSTAGGQRRIARALFLIDEEDMAKGYIIARVSVLDGEGYKIYATAASEAIRKYGGRPLARGGRCEILEGEGRMRNVILEFDSYEQARTYYYSAEYQSALKHRIGISVGDFILVEGT